MPNSSPKSSGSRCPTCGGYGTIGWKTPASGYSIEECDWCKCDAGVAAFDAARRAEAARQQRDLFARIRKAGIPAHFQGMTIDSLRAIAGNEPEKAAAIEAVAAIASGGTVDGRHGLYVFGDYGTGKTGCLTPIVAAAVAERKSALWLEFYDLIDSVQAQYGQGGADDIMESVRGCDVLLLDDVGDNTRQDRYTGIQETEDRKRILYQIVNYRHNHSLPMLISSNCTPSIFAQQFGARTFDRIAESCAIIRMGGRNLRGTV